MREIFVLNAGRPALVDDADFALVAGKRWQLHTGTHAAHFYRDPVAKKSRMVLMHRLILQPPAGVVVDHIDHDGLNNQRANLRQCSQAENVRNQRKTRGRSRYKGVLQTPNGRWRAEITKDYRNRHIGVFDSEEAAARAYDAAARELFGAFAHPNFPEDRV